jgi:hypothetical protein
VLGSLTLRLTCAPRLADVGRASRAKKERKRAGRQRPSLLRKLGEQHEILERLGALSALFDDGTPLLALPLATAVRVLVHDTGNSKSLLNQLGEKDSLRFVDTAAHIDARNLAATPGLVIAELMMGSGARWVPPLNGGSSGTSRRHRPLRFRAWWTMPVTHVHSPVGKTWSRKDFILHVANKEGGAHIDPNEPEAMIHSLEEHNLLGLMYRDPVVGDQRVSNGPLLPSVRQIALEVQRTIEPLIYGSDLGEHT